VAETMPGLIESKPWGGFMFVEIAIDEGPSREVSINDNDDLSSLAAKIIQAGDRLDSGRQES